MREKKQHRNVWLIVISIAATISGSSLSALASQGTRISDKDAWISRGAYRQQLIP